MPRMAIRAQPGPLLATVRLAGRIPDAVIDDEQIIEQRLNRKAMGFGAEIRGRADVRLVEEFAGWVAVTLDSARLYEEFPGRSGTVRRPRWPRRQFLLYYLI